MFDTERCFFYITNDWTTPAVEIVREANRRCNQENTIAQGKSARVLSAPLDTLLSNWAYMVIASLACSIKAWCALLIPVDDASPDKERQEKEKRRLLTMEFTTFRNAFMNIPAQIVRTGRRLVCRLLGWNRWLDPLFRLVDFPRTPLRC